MLARHVAAHERWRCAEMDARSLVWTALQHAAAALRGCKDVWSVGVARCRQATGIPSGMGWATVRIADRDRVTFMQR